MFKYRKKPVVIEAFKWTGNQEQIEDPKWIVKAIVSGTVTFVNPGTGDVIMMIQTLEGSMAANQGDYIIQGIQGELYPCKPGIFEKTYDKVD